MPKVVDHQERRNSIARSACRAIADTGLAEVTMRDIASAAGVTTGAVTHYFDSKDEILEAALEVIAADSLDRLNGTAPEELTDFLDLLALAMPTTPQLSSEWRVWLAFWARSTPGGDVLRIYNERFRSGWLILLEQRLEELQQGGAIHLDDEPSLVAARVSHIINGISLEACLDPEGWPAERQTTELDTIVTPMLTMKR